MMTSRLSLATLLCVALFSLSPLNAESLTLPLVKSQEKLLVTDDLDFENLDLAITRQLESFKRYPLEGELIIDSKKYPRTIIKTSLLKLRKAVREYQSCQKDSSKCLESFQKDIQQNFDFFRPNSSVHEQKKALFTAYYSPVLVGSKTPTQEYPHGLYSRPQDERLRFESTRVDIDLDGVLEGRGLELFYTESLFDLYMLHIEGGGKINIKTDKGLESYYLSYDGTNQQRWRFLSSYMIEQGYINSHDMEEQKAFLDQHPEKWREVYSLCPSYVYFKVTETPPEGLNEIPLTDYRSMAQDRDIYPQKGLIGFVQTNRPIRDDSGEITYIPFSRLFIDQDTGGAIKGDARADLYFGEDEQARLAGLNLKQYGNITFLLSL